MWTITSKYYLHIIFILTVVDFPKIREKLREAWENKSRKGDVGT